uniref:Uncharacterized protein n=1 Tax=Trichuris muris TaxID=70415 RepID=A0A5S6QT08_TRIMR
MCVQRADDPPGGAKFTSNVPRDDMPSYRQAVFHVHVFPRLRSRGPKCSELLADSEVSADTISLIAYKQPGMTNLHTIIVHAIPKWLETNGSNDHNKDQSIVLTLHRLLTYPVAMEVGGVAYNDRPPMLSGMRSKSTSTAGPKNN